MRTLCLAIDPGPARSGFALVELRMVPQLPMRTGGANTKVTFNLLLGTHCSPADPKLALGALLAKVASEGGIAAIETVTVYDRARVRAQARALVDTGRTEGKLIEAVGNAGIPAVRQITATAALWRGALCRNRTASDAQVRIAVEALVGSLDVPSKERAHVFDAAGLAMFALCYTNGILELRGRVRLVSLRPETERALAVQRATEKARRQLRKVTKAAGVKLPHGLRARANARAGSKLVKEARR